MKKFLLPASFLVIISLAACGGDSTETTTSDSTVIENTLPGAPVIVDSTVTNPIDSAKAAVISSSPVAAPTVTPSVTPSTVTAQSQPKIAGKAGPLNPEHGKPNHRCDIPVGTPLSTPIQQVQQQAPNMPVQQPQPQLQPAGKASGSAKLNPAHGQPGHDCAVPVGQPLKS